MLGYGDEPHYVAGDDPAAMHALMAATLDVVLEKKWRDTARRIPWRAPIASHNSLLTSHVWRQDQNGSSHQDPGFIDHVTNKKADVVRV